MLDLMIIASSVISFGNMLVLAYFTRVYFPERLKKKQSAFENKQAAYKEISMSLYEYEVDKAISIAAIFSSETIYNLIIEMKEFDGKSYKEKYSVVTTEMRKDLGVA